MSTEFRLNNDTLLRGFLSHLQSQVRELAALRGMAEMHASNTPERAGQRIQESRAKEMRETWDVLRRDLAKVLGPEVQLKTFEGLVAPGTFHAGNNNCPTPDPFRITFRVLKARADKARRHDPTITLLKSWDLQAKEPPKDKWDPYYD